MSRDVRVRVAVTALHHDGHTYGRDDEMLVPAEHVKSWLASGFVQLVDQEAEFSGNGR